jgi:hypothetical protein
MNSFGYPLWGHISATFTQHNNMYYTCYLKAKFKQLSKLKIFFMRIFLEVLNMNYIPLPLLEKMVLLSIIKEEPKIVPMF